MGLNIVSNSSDFDPYVKYNAKSGGSYMTAMPPKKQGSSDHFQTPNWALNLPKQINFTGAE